MKTRNIITATAALIVVSALSFGSGYTVAAQETSAQVATVTQAAQKHEAECISAAVWHAPLLKPNCVLRADATLDDYLTKRCICG